MRISPKSKADLCRGGSLLLNVLLLLPVVRQSGSSNHPQQAEELIPVTNLRLQPNFDGFCHGVGENTQAWRKKHLAVENGTSGYVPESNACWICSFCPNERSQRESAKAIQEAESQSLCQQTQATCPIKRSWILLLSKPKPSQRESQSHPDMILLSRSSQRGSAKAIQEAESQSLCQQTTAMDAYYGDYGGIGRGAGMNIMGGLQTIGIMNSLKTGDPFLDTLLAMLLPALIGIALAWLGKIKTRFIRFLELRWLRRQKRYRSTINHKQNSRDSAHNELLIKAIGFYIHSCCDVKLDEAELKLISLDADKVADDEDQLDRYGACQGFSGNYKGSSKITSKGHLLKTCKIVKQPKNSEQHNVGVFDGAPIWVCFQENVNTPLSHKDTSKEPQWRESSTSLYLESTGKTSIDSFVNAALEWYKGELNKLKNDTRYLYDFDPIEHGDNTAVHLRDLLRTGPTQTYTRYPLGEEKSFDTLFCRKKTEPLILLVDQFQAKAGKYAVPGFPHKLGILLTGSPGTGKTSLIKALAIYTKRQIVTVPLSRIGTNRDLNALMFNTRYTVNGLATPVTLGHRDIIYVLEDVDAAADVVKRRDLIHESLEKTGDEGDDDADERNGKSPRKRPPADALSLAGLLNALDGVVDTPGRIVIMTTNHPDVLDPALVRAGRIDRNIELGCMEMDDAKEMIEYYFQTKFSNAELDRFCQIFVTSSNETGASDGLQITPAEMEQLIMAEPSIAGLMKRLETMKEAGGEALFVKEQRRRVALPTSSQEFSNESSPQRQPW